jgi:hypothetical protein
VSPEDAARIVQLLTLAVEAEINGAVLNARGWRFTRSGLDRYLAKMARRAAKRDDAA